jgi:Protein of unknown function (DUF2934)
MANSIENKYPPEATVGDQWQRGATGEFRERVDLFTLSPTELHKRISQVAHRLYLCRGKVHGHDLDDWLAAERIRDRFTEIPQELEDEANGKEI